MWPRCSSPERSTPRKARLPALAPLYTADGRLPIVPFDGHYDAAANRAMGAYIAEHLLALGVPERAE